MLVEVDHLSPCWCSSGGVSAWSRGDDLGVLWGVQNLHWENLHWRGSLRLLSWAPPGVLAQTLVPCKTVVLGSA